jgi:hypothetical protein
MGLVVLVDGRRLGGKERMLVGRVKSEKPRGGAMKRE